MNARNKALLSRGRAHGVELSPEDEAKCHEADQAAEDAAAALTNATDEIARVEAIVAPYMERLKALRETVKTEKVKVAPLRETAKLTRQALVNLSIKAAQDARTTAEIAAARKRLADAEARRVAAGLPPL